MEDNLQTILLVEDEAINAMLARKILEKNGYNVIISHNGEKAIDAVKQNPMINLVLMDIDLGTGIDGTEAAVQILKNYDLPLVFLSSHTEPEIVEKTEGITSYGYIVKNSGETVLIASIKMAFRLFDEKKRVKQHEKELETTTTALQISETGVRKRLKAILDPDSDISSLSLTDILDIPQIQAMMGKFYELTGILSAVLDLSGNILVAVGWQDICTKFHRCHPETLKNCVESDTELSKGVKAGEFKLYKCKNNLWDMVTPIEIYGKHMGNIFFGQFFFEDEIPDRKFFIEQARRFNFAEKEYLTALDKVPRFSKKQVETAMSFIAGLTDIISTMSFRTIQLARKITEQQRTEEILREGEAYIKSIFRAAPTGIGVVIDRVLVQVNEKICELTGYSRDELLGQSARILYPSDKEYKYVGEEKYRQIRDNGTGTVETQWMKKNGEIIDVLLRSTQLGIENLKKGVTFTALDITENKRSEKTLKLKTEELAAVIEEQEATNEELIAAMEELEAANEEIISSNEELMGKEKTLLIEKNNNENLIHSLKERIKEISCLFSISRDMNRGLSIEKFCENIINYIPRAFQFPEITVPYIELEGKIFAGKNYKSSLGNKIESEIKLSNESIGRISVYYTEEEPFIIPEEQNLVNSIAETLAVQVQHVKDSTALHESEELYRSIFNDHVAVKLMIDPQTGYIIDANKAAAKFYGWPVEELKRMNISQINTLPLEEVNKEIEKAINLKRIQFKFKHRIADGTVKDVEIYSCGLEVKGKTVLHSIIHDITYRTKAEETIESLLKEKELLLRETHHRVKNNMNTLHALLYLQAEEQHDPVSKRIINEAAARVKGMMILYDKLYRSINITESEAEQFFSELINEIIKIYNTGGPVKTEVKIPGLNIKSKILSTLGIIINELTVNSLKYAFSGINEGLISLSAEEDEDTIKIIYRDNGIGLPENFAIDNSKGFGMYLINMLLEIIGGTINFQESEGAEFIIEISK